MSIRKTFQPPQTPLRTGAKEKKAMEHLGKAVVAGEAKGKNKARNAAKTKSAQPTKKTEATQESSFNEEADHFSMEHQGAATPWQGREKSVEPDGAFVGTGAKKGTLVSARLQATSKGELEKSTLEKDVLLEVPDDFQLLLGVGRITGNLEIAESAAKSTDLGLLRDLVRVDGKLSIEGNAQLQSLDGLGSLEQVGKGVYIAFNDNLQNVLLPKLKRVKGPFIVEANASLEKLSLSSLQFISGYLHVHENGSLKQVLAKKLLEVDREVSFLDNPALEQVAFDAMPDPSGEVEVERSGVAAELNA
ncbi:MAG: hypothetical protein GY822_32950 [Deltaproteobacteria bacterium]|nr:hypothetical protein [Deltaproteobacteria bacterium]